MSSQNGSGTGVQPAPIVDPVSRRRLLAGAGVATVLGGLGLAGSRPGLAQAAARGSCTNVKDHGAVGNGSADDTEAIQSAIDESQGSVYVPAGIYRVSTLIYRDNLQLLGDGAGLTILRLDPDESGAILGGKVGGIGALAPVEELYLEGIAFDGDAENSNESGGQAALFHSYACHRIHLLRCDFINGRGYGVGLQGYPAASESDKRGPQTDIYIEKCRFLNNGADLNADGLDIKSAERVTLIDCIAYGNDDKGFNVRGRFVTAVGCRAYNNDIGMDFNTAASVTETTTLASAISSSSTSIPLGSVSHLPPQGFVRIGSELISYTGISGSTLTDCERGVGRGAAQSHSSGATVTLNDNGSWTQLLGCAADNNDNSGIALSATEPSVHRADVVACHARENGGNGLTTNISSGELHLNVTGGQYSANSVRGLGIGGAASVSISDSAIHGNAADGIRFTNQSAGAKVIGADVRDNGAHGIRSTGSSDNFIFVGNTFRGNTNGSHTVVGNVNRNVANDSDQTITFNSASSMTFPNDSNYFNINGTTNITSITASSPGRILVLKFAASLTVVDGSNLKLAGNFVTSADDTLTLACDGTNWCEVCRSVN